VDKNIFESDYGRTTTSSAKQQLPLEGSETAENSKPIVLLFPILLKISWNLLKREEFESRHCSGIEFL